MNADDLLALFAIKELQLFGIIIIISIGVYVLFLIGRKVLAFVSGRENQEVDEEKVMSAFSRQKEADHQVSQSKNISIKAKKVSVDDDVVLKLSFNPVLIERLVVGLVILIELAIICWQYLA